MQGYGYATESLQAVIDWGRLQFNIHKYVAVCERGNFASQKVLTKLGFNLEAEFNAPVGELGLQPAHNAGMHLAYA